jgi:hypothetical protein
VADAGPDEDGGAGERHRARTFRIRPGAPRGKSFAAEIAEQHGISFQQLARRLRQRGLPAPQADPDADPDPG